MSETKSYLPHFAEGTVVAGFGRGGKDLGIPTANYPEDVINHLPPNFECGVYFGWAKVSDSDVFKMVMCVGWNPYFHNTVKTMETHIIHKFDNDFYGDHLKIIALGYIRAMCDYSSLDALIEAIQHDIAEAERRLEEPNFKQYKNHSFFSAPPNLTTASMSTATTAPYITASSHQVNLPNGDGSGSLVESSSCQQNDHAKVSKILGSEETATKKTPERSINGFMNGGHSFDEKEIHLTNLKAKNKCSKKTNEQNLIHEKTLSTAALSNSSKSEDKLDEHDCIGTVHCENNICRL